MPRSLLISIPLLSLLVACGGSPPPPPAAPEKATAPSPAPADTAAAAAPAEEASSRKLPDACSGDAGSCTMPAGFVKRLCSGVHPDLAIYLFAGGSPWRRTYVAVREAAPFNGLNGPSSDEKLVFEEEVLVLSEKKVDTGGMQVSGAGASYDVLRWDGTCATLSAEEVRFQAPSKPKHATVPWRSLGDGTQAALLEDEKVGKIAAERRKECKGATVGTVSDKCEKADRKLNDLVVEAVRGGKKVPEPAKLP
jgi:hypothetical protein